MECNKEEAIRAKNIAEKKMQSKDFLSARKIALKAQQLFPDLENITQMLTVCEVHCSAATKVNGSEDWYGILQVEPTADEFSIKKQYRKLALLLHPDKNRLEGAEAAFKLIGEAHMTLTDQAKRSLYDAKRRSSVRIVSPKPPPQKASQNSFAAAQSAVPLNSKNRGTQFSGPSQQQQTQAAGCGYANSTFWTFCPFCGIRYQYYCSIMNRALRCQHCSKTFIAYDMNAMPTGMHSGHPAKQPGIPQGNGFPPGHPAKQPGIPQGNGFPGQGAFKTTQGSHFHNTSSTGGGFQGDMSGQPAVPGWSGVENNTGFGGKSRNKVKEENQSQNNPKQENEVKFEKVTLEKVNGREQMAKPSRNSKRKKERKATVNGTDDEEFSDTETSDSEEVIIEGAHKVPWNDMAGNKNPRRSSRQRQNVIYTEDQSDDDDFVSPKRSRKERSSHDSDAKEKIHKDGQNYHNDQNNGKCMAPEENLQNEGQKDMENSEMETPENRNSMKASPSTESDSDFMLYPDPEFHDFDKDREVNIFAAGQIWALYDDLDGMPRFYAKINSVSLPNFKVRFSWLEVVSANQAEAEWLEAELPVASGNFKLGKTETSENAPMFSHMMAWEKGARKNSYVLHPRKGEVWALYRGWDIKWSSEPEKHHSYEYDIVEVLSDYVEGVGTSVATLVKVKGFVSLFARSIHDSTFRVSSNEMLKFSHMIPSYRMMAMVEKGIPEGSYELDPASLPSDLENKFPSVSFDVSDSKTGNVGVEIGRPHCESGNEVKPSHVENLGKSLNEKKNRTENENIISGNCNSGKPADENKGRERQIPLPEVGKKKSSDAGASNCQKEEQRPDLACSNKSEDIEKHNLPASPSNTSSDIEYHDFDSDRTCSKIRTGQVWALYCDLDGFPKYYAFINKVEEKFFKAHVTWLEACPTLEQEVKWYKKDLPIVCGRFKLSPDKVDEIYDSTETFSHLVHNGTNQQKRHYDIFPCAGEVWALYRNWSIEWTGTELERCEYDVVEVLANTGGVVMVMFLVKMDGSRSIFMPKRSSEGEVARMEIPRVELMRFSHQIPSFRLTEDRGVKMRGCWQLDPASLPESLL